MAPPSFKISGVPWQLLLLLTWKNNWGNLSKMFLTKSKSAP